MLWVARHVESHAELGHHSTEASRGAAQQFPGAAAPPVEQNLDGSCELEVHSQSRQPWFERFFGTGQLLGDFLLKRLQLRHGNKCQFCRTLCRQLDTGLSPQRLTHYLCQKLAPVHDRNLPTRRIPTTSDGSAYEKRPCLCGPWAASAATAGHPRATPDLSRPPTTVFGKLAVITEA